MPLGIHPSLLPDDMIRNFPQPKKTVFLRITAPTAIRGEHLSAGEVVEVETDDANNVISAGRGEITTAPVETSAPEAAAEGEAGKDSSKKKQKA